MIERDDESPGAPPVVAHPCAVCAQEAPWEVWEVRFCPPCCTRLMDALPYTPTGFGCSEDDFPAVAKAKTREWVASHRALRRVA